MAEYENTLVAEPGEVYDELDIRPVQAPNVLGWNVLDLINRAVESAKTKAEMRRWLEEQLRLATVEDLEKIQHVWKFWARHNQIAPEGDWTFWLLLAGRGFGKTRTGAEWINERVLSGLAKRIALVAPTAADVRKVMVEGESGILATAPPWNRPTFEPSKLQLTWPNGAIAQLFSAEEPERLRGPQCDTFWADELAAWKKMQETWDMLQFGFRLGTDPRGCITTTPKPLPIVKQLVSNDRNMPVSLRGEEWDGEVAVTRGSTYDNKANLTPKFYKSVVKKYEGTRLGRQELEAAILEDMPGALWVRSQLDANRIKGVLPLPPILPDADPATGERSYEDMEVLQRHAEAILNAVPEDLVRISVNVDPNVSNDEGSDEIGITVTAKGISGHGYTLADCSIKGSPDEWASVSVIAHDIFGADRIVGEANQGGNMVQYTLEQTAKNLKDNGIDQPGGGKWKRKSDFVGITLVHATRGKVTRAEPVSLLYEQNRISHVGTMKVLEDQMCLFTSDFDRKAMGYSPDRVDSVVWGFTHLFHEEQGGAGIFEFMKAEAMRVAKAQNPEVEDHSDRIKMSAPKNTQTLYGMEGDKYVVKSGFIFVKPSDLKCARVAGFVEAEVP